MSLAITERQREGIVILDLEGRLTVGEETGALREAVLKLNTAGQVNVILNLEQVEYIDSTGLGGLVICFTTLKRGGGAPHLALDDAPEVSSARGAELLALDDALTALHALNARQSQIVELRYFGGLSEDETAEVLKISPRTVRRDWSLARAWLYRELNREGTNDA